MKKVLSLLLTLAMVASLFVFPSMATTPAGTAVTTAAEFAAMTANGTYYLANDITISATYANVFTGTFDGNGKTITTSVPVFAEVAGGTIKNLTVGGEINLKASNQGAVICVTNASKAGNTVIENVTNNAKIISTSGNVGGIVGKVTGPATASTSSSLTIINCVNNGDISAKGHTGGIVGYRHDDIIKSGQPYTVVIENCVNNGDITTTTASVGGITGAMCTGNDTTDKGIVTIISGCTNNGNITSTNTGSANGYSGVAGICAAISCKATITLCRNTGAITSKKQHCGGIVGLVRYAVNFLTISNCDSLGTVKGTAIYGQIIGNIPNEQLSSLSCYINIKNCYTTGTTAICGGPQNPTITGTPTVSHDAVELGYIQIAAEAELREYTSSAIDERLTALVDGYVDDIWTETNSSAIAGIVINAKEAYDLAAKKVAAEAELREYSSSATDERILNIVSTAIADIWNQTSALVVWGKRDKAKADIDLVNYQIAAANELREMTSSANDQRITEVLSGAIDMIDGAISKGFIDDHKPIFINVLNAALARLAAENEVKAYAQGSTNEIIVTIVSSSIDEIWSSATSTAVLPVVVQKYKTQIDAYKAAVDAEGAIRAYASSATDQRILDVVSSACAEVWTKATSSAIEQVKTKAFEDIDVFNSLIAIADEIRELTSTATDKRITDFASAAIGALNSYTSVSSGAIDSLRTIFIGEINIRFARLAAENEVKDYANGSTQQVIVAIVSSSIEEIWSSATSTGILPAVVQKYKDQIDTYKATIDAEAAIREYSSSATDERILEVVSAAIAELWTKDTSSAIEQSKLDAFAAIDLVIAKVNAEAVVKKAAGTNDFYKLYVNSVEKQLIWDKNTVEEVKAGEQTILDAIELNKTKVAAVIELKDDRDENEDEAIVAIASTAIENIKEAADSSAVAEILSQAIADIEFEVYTNDAQAAVAAEAEGETDEAIKAIESQAIADIENAETKAEIDTLKAEAIAKIQLIKAKIAAEALIRGEIPAGTDARVVEIASNAIAEVWAKLGPDAVEEAKSAAIAAIKLGNAKVSAEADVQAEVPADASAAVKEIESTAIANIWAAKTEAEVEDVKSTAIAAIRAKILAENPVTADTTVWLVVVAAVALLGAAIVSKKVFF